MKKNRPQIAILRTSILGPAGLLNDVDDLWGAKYGYGPKQIISETGTLRSETFIFRNIVP